jgi:hypothetical protein
MPPPAVEIACPPILKDVPTRLDLRKTDDEIVEALRATGAPPEVASAHKKTGLLGDAGIVDNWPTDRRKEWENAVDEYFALEEQAKAKRD